MTLTARDRILLGVIVVLIAGFGFYHFALSPQRKQAAALAMKVSAQQTALTHAESEYASGIAAAKQLEAITPMWTAAGRAVPTTSDIPGLLRLLQREATAAHVDLRSISLSAGSSSLASTEATPTSVDGATAVPVALTIGGGYQALNRLVTRLDDLVETSGDGLRVSGPLVGISEVSLSGSGSNLSVSLTASIYQQASASTVTGETTEGAS